MQSTFRHRNRRRDKTLGLHAFRRGTATTLHEHGIDDKTIQGVMRHSELRTTQNIYIKTNTETAREGLQKVGESFRSRKVVPNKRKSG